MHVIIVQIQFQRNENQQLVPQHAPMLELVATGRVQSQSGTVIRIHRSSYTYWPDQHPVQLPTAQVKDVHLDRSGTILHKRALVSGIEWSKWNDCLQLFDWRLSQLCMS